MAGVANTPVDRLYEGSNGQYYTEWEVSRQFRRGAWQLCLRQTTPDRQLVETGGKRLLMLTAIDVCNAPSWVEIRVRGESARVVDTRRFSRSNSSHDESGG
ncbi:hypothetical protein [Natronolimnobius baerhuensis]|uniref:Uncharacterized protein n=1 Tax=Natronolimnobius baerhuensis TaxID=253108 RepID=A0A202EDW2_9EURY|nr:hypothetical protein [Natronolimnobius baerhuensis]OVE86442.1 hypothetical protein B2G88_04275 [Natronolimnobius baerhuensis]